MKMTILIGETTIVGTQFITHVERFSDHITIYFSNNKSTIVGFTTKKECDAEWDRLCELLNERAL